MNIKKTFYIVLSLLFLTSCVSKKRITYFQFDQVEQAKVSNNYTTIFKPDDLLQITISASDIDAAKPFNLPAVTFSAASNSIAGAPQQQTYLVDFLYQNIFFQI